MLNTSELRRLAAKYVEDGVGGNLLRQSFPAMCDEIDRLREGLRDDFVLPDDAWVDSYVDEDGMAPHLVARITINGTDMHLEAIAIDSDSDTQSASNSDENEDLGFIHAAVSADGHWDTTTINGREYVLIATPFC